MKMTPEYRQRLRALIAKTVEDHVLQEVVSPDGTDVHADDVQDALKLVAALVGNTLYRENLGQQQESLLKDTLPLVLGPEGGYPKGLKDIFTIEPYEEPQRCSCSRTRNGETIFGGFHLLGDKAVCNTCGRPR